MDYNSVFISKSELRWLRKLCKNPSGLRSRPPETNLMEYRLITRDIWYDESGSSLGLHSKISDTGIRYLKYLRQQRKLSRRESFRFLLSTILAILALLIAIAALLIDLWQLGLL